MINLHPAPEETYTASGAKPKTETSEKNTASHSSHAKATHGTHLKSKMPRAIIIFACGYTTTAPFLKPVAVINNPTHG